MSCYLGAAIIFISSSSLSLRCRDCRPRQFRAIGEDTQRERERETTWLGPNGDAENWVAEKKMRLLHRMPPPSPPPLHLRLVCRATEMRDWASDYWDVRICGHCLELSGLEWFCSLSCFFMSDVHCTWLFVWGTMHLALLEIAFCLLHFVALKYTVCIPL